MKSVIGLLLKINFKSVNNRSENSRGQSRIDLYRCLIMALVLNIPVICLILFLDIKSADFTLLSVVYVFCVFIGYYVLPLLLIVTLLFLFLFAFKRLLLISAGVITAVYIYYLLIDYFVYHVAKIHIDFFWLEVIFNDYQGFGLPVSTLRNVLLILLGIIGAEIGIFAIARRIGKPKYLILAFSLFTILAFCVSQVIHVFAYEINDDRITSLTPRLPIYIPIISRRDAVKYGELLPIFETESGGGMNDHKSSLNYPLKDIMYNTPLGKELPNIVIILLESWRFDVMDETVSPNIYALSKKSSVFLDHICSGNSTVAGVFGLFYGLHPTYWTAVKANSVRIDNPVFIDVLKNNQYNFGIYAKSNFNRHKINDTIFRGIEAHESFAGETIVEQDKDMTEQLLSFLREQANDSSRFMAMAFFKSSHFPYHYTKNDSIFLPAADLNFMSASDDTDPLYYLNDYRNSIHYVDRLIGGIIQNLDSLGEMSNTIIIVTTDHSEELNDNRANYWGHGSNFTQYQIKVPLILYIPDRQPRQIEYRTSHLDIPTTLLQEIFGCSNDIRDYSNGRNLFEKQTELRPLVIGNYVNHAFVIEDNVYEIYPMYTKKYKLNDINTKASSPPFEIIKIIKEEINRFYYDNNTIEND